MTELCPKCLNKEEVVMKRVSVSKALSKTSVGSLFSSRYMYLPHHCPKCKFEVSLITYRWHFLEGSWICMKCEDSKADTIELRKSVKGNIIEVNYRCMKCGNEWTTKIEFYR
jgi:DNA-directed RNA polymerase subunit M/transcription elongation factor TFIIS